MANQMKCPHCGQVYAAPEDLSRSANQTIVCTTCQRPFQVGPDGISTFAGTVAAPPPVAQPVTYAHMAHGPGAGPQISNPMAVVALVLGCASILIPILAIVAIILGIIALAKTKNPNVAGKGMAIGGICAGGAVLLISICLISILVPSLSRARETANRVKCASNMRQIGQAMMLYASQNQGLYPPTPDLLISPQLLNPAVFICPSTPHAPGTTAQSILVQGQNSYVYVGAGFGNTSSMDAILLYEMPTNQMEMEPISYSATGTSSFYPQARRG